MTDDEKRELIKEARDVGEYLADNEYYEYRLIARLADALEGTLTEPEWETTLVWDNAHRLDMSEGSRWPDLRSALEQHGYDPSLADRAGSLTYNPRGGDPDYRAAPKLMRRRKAGPWEVVTDDRD